MPGKKSKAAKPETPQKRAGVSVYSRPERLAAAHRARALGGLAGLIGGGAIGVLLHPTNFFIAGVYALICGIVLWVVAWWVATEIQRAALRLELQDRRQRAEEEAQRRREAHRLALQEQAAQAAAHAQA